MKQFVDLNIEIVVGVVISVLERGISEQSRWIGNSQTMSQ